MPLIRVSQIVYDTLKKLKKDMTFSDYLAYLLEADIRRFEDVKRKTEKKD